MENNLRSSLKTYEQRLGGANVIVLILLVMVSIWITYYAHWVQRTDVVFTHFFYVPLVWAGFWWTKRAIWVAVFLGGWLLASHVISGLDVPYTLELLRLIMFIVVAAVVGKLRELSLKTELALQNEINERKRMEKELQSAYKILKEQHERRMDFTNVAAHELRTPLVPIIGYLEMFKEEVRNEKALHYIEVMERNAMRQCRLIDSLLELSRLDVGKIELKYSDINVNKFLQLMLEDYAPTKRKFVVDILKNFMIRADADKLFQILDNLISNAIKYSTADTEIKICAEERGSDYLFKVIDRGIGIAEEDHERIFERFYIVGGNKTDRAVNRCGLGLALTKSYIELHGGKIWVESEPGKGSTFYFTIPGSTSIKN